MPSTITFRPGPLYRGSAGSFKVAVIRSCWEGTDSHFRFSFGSNYLEIHFLKKGFYEFTKTRYVLCCKTWSGERRSATPRTLKSQQDVGRPYATSTPNKAIQAPSQKGVATLPRRRRIPRQAQQFTFYRSQGFTNVLSATVFHSNDDVNLFGYNNAKSSNKKF